MAEMSRPTFEDRCVISCGMLYPEITHLMESGFLNPRRILFAPPGLHALPDRLEEHLLKRLAQARKWCPDHGRLPNTYRRVWEEVPHQR